MPQAGAAQSSQADTRGWLRGRHDAVLHDIWVLRGQRPNLFLQCCHSSMSTCAGAQASGLGPQAVPRTPSSIVGGRTASHSVPNVSFRGPALWYQWDMAQFWDYVVALREIGPYRHAARDISTSIRRLQERGSSASIHELTRLEAQINQALLSLAQIQQRLERDAPDHIADIRSSLAQSLQLITELRSVTRREGG